MQMIPPQNPLGNRDLHLVYSYFKLISEHDYDFNHSKTELLLIYFNASFNFTRLLKILPKNLLHKSRNKMLFIY